MDYGNNSKTDNSNSNYYYCLNRIEGLAPLYNFPSLGGLYLRNSEWLGEGLSYCLDLSVAQPLVRLFFVYTEEGAEGLQPCVISLRTVVGRIQARHVESDSIATELKVLKATIFGRIAFSWVLHMYTL